MFVTESIILLWWLAVLEQQLLLRRFFIYIFVPSYIGLTRRRFAIMRLPLPNFFSDTTINCFCYFYNLSKGETDWLTFSCSLCGVIHAGLGWALIVICEEEKKNHTPWNTKTQLFFRYFIFSFRNKIEWFFSLIFFFCFFFPLLVVVCWFSRCCCWLVWWRWVIVMADVVSSFTYKNINLTNKRIVVSKTRNKIFLFFYFFLLGNNWISFLFLTI